MRIIKTDNYEKMSEAAAALIADLISEKEDATLGLATGSSPIELYKKLIEWNKEGTIDFSKVKTVNLDEYVGLPPESKNSYRSVMNEFLFDHINIKKENTFIPDGMSEDVEKECGKYEDLISSLGGVDLQLLGVGHNGHIGFNEPGTSFDSTVHVVDLTDDTINANKRFFEREEDVPRRAITMGIGTIMKAKEIILVATGINKAEIISKIIDGPVTSDVPASIIKTHPNTIIIADSDALSMTKNI